MVIACPKCQRKYQIDTARIPRGGTTFTCWSCRAQVPVGAETAPSVDRAISGPLRPPEPTTPAAPQKPSVPPSAMRLFESLAAEGAQRTTGALSPKTPADAPQVVAPPAIVAPPPAAPEPKVPAPITNIVAPREGAQRTQAMSLDEVSAITSAKVSSPPPPAPPRPPVPAAQPPAPVMPPSMYSTQAMPVDDVARVASQAAKPTLDLLGGDEVLDLPSFGLITTAPSKGDVLDVDLGSAPTPPPIIAPPAAPPAAPTGGATLVMSSPARPAPPPLAAPPPPVVEAPPEAPRFDIPRPEPLRTVPLPIAPSPSEPERPESKLDYRAAARPRPPAVEPPAPPPAPAIEPQPSEDFFQPLLAPSSDRVSPAELSGEPEAWVAPTVAPSAGRRKSKTRLPLVAVLVVAILGGGGYALWTYAVRDLVSPQRESAGPVSTPPTEAGPDKPKTDQPPTIETPKMAPTKSALPPVADATPTIPPGPGNFTLQVQSNPDEAASNALAERLKSNGVDAYVVRADLGAKGIWFRVRVGRYETSEEARAKGSSMRASGKIPSFIVVAWE